MKNILIAAIDRALGLPLAASHLALSDLHVFYLVSPTDPQLSDELTISLGTLVREISPEVTAAECLRQVEKSIFWNKAASHDNERRSENAIKEESHCEGSHRRPPYRRVYSKSTD